MMISWFWILTERCHNPELHIPPFPDQSLIFYPFDRTLTERIEKSHSHVAVSSIIAGPGNNALLIRMGIRISWSRFRFNLADCTQTRAFSFFKYT
jgi:hypothetical protein